ncbi:MAG: hypothetical protein JXA03_14045 [Bacteroidales bacterium]|nr:hypothetical protein [Bacteroidales bacterium]
MKWKFKLFPLVLLFALFLWQPVSFAQAPDIVSVEYFLDSDPGFGNGAQVPVTAGANIDENFSIDLAAIPTGFHKLFIRVKNSNGKWSLTDLRDIFKIRMPDSPPPAKDVVSLEYFFDTDPGFGNGMSLPVTTGLAINENYVIDITSLTVGFHVIFFRVQDSDGVWSFTDKRDIFKIRLPDPQPPAKDVTALEYFFDTDPGFGSATSLPVTAGLNIDKDYVIDITSLTVGFHVIFFRVQDSDGIWSFTDKRDIFKIRLPDPPPPTKDVVGLEYFFDTDPGFGNGTSLPVTSGLNIDESYSVDITSLSDGFHTLFFRVQDSNEVWSLTDKRDIFKIRLPDPSPPTKDVVALEYFFDTDPGFGNGASLPVTTGLNIDESYSLDISGLSAGFHTLFFRVKDSDSLWSLTDKRDIFKLETTGPRPPAPNLAAMEYFIDTDPGFGNGTPVPVPASQNVDESFLVDVSGLITGNHILFVRVLDENGNWTLTHIEQYCHPPTADFSADNVWFGDPTTFTDLSLNTEPTTEYYWDVDGDGTPDYTYNTGFQHTYSAPGNYFASLVLVSQEGCSDTIVKEVFVFTCDPPSGLMTTNVTANTATVEWTPANMEPAWDIEYGQDGFTPGTGTVIYGLTANSYELLGLASNTDYDFYVRASCYVGAYSSWAGPGSFTTLEGNPCVNPTDGGTIADSQTICGGSVPDSLTSLSPATGYTGILEYKWQISTDNVNWTDIPGTNTEGYSHNAAITVDTWFRRLARVTCMFDWIGAAESNVVKISVRTKEQFRTISSGNWNDPLIWQYYDGTQWVAASHFPTADSLICPDPVATIQNGHTVTITEDVNYGNVIVDTTGTLDIPGDKKLGIIAADSLIVHGTLITHNTGMVNGTGNFVISPNATMHVGSADGITISDAAGNVQVAGSRIYSEGANYIYIGIANQVTGSGLTQYTPASVTINAPGVVVTLSYELTVSGNITISQGTLDVNNLNIWIGGSWFNFGTFIPGTATVYFTGSVNVYVSVSNFYNIVFAGTGPVIATGTLTIYGNVTINANGIFEGGSYNHYVYGNWSNNGSFVYGTSTVNFVGNGNIFISVSNFYNIVFGGTGTVTASGSLTIFGNVAINNYFDPGSFTHYVYGNWVNSGVFVYGASTIYFLGSGNITVGVSNFYNVVFAGTGTVTATGTLTFYGNVTINNYFAGGAFTHYVYGNWTNNGTFVYGTSTINFVGTATVYISVSNFYNIIFSGSGTYIATGSLTVAGDLVINSNFNAGAFTHYVEGNWTNNGTFYYGTSTIEFTGSGTVTISVNNFYSVVFAGTGTYVATGSLTFFGDVTINSSFDAATFDHYVHGNWTNNGIFIYGTSTIHFVGSLNVFIGVSNFYNVVFGGTGTITASGSLTFFGDVTINNYFNAGSFVHYLYGGWFNYGTFVYGTSTISFVGSGNIFLSVNNFYNVVFAGTGTITATGSITFYGDVTIDSYFDAATFGHWVYGNWTVNGTFVYGTSTIHFVPTGNIFISISNFYNIIFAGTGTITATGSLTIYGNVTINNHFAGGAFAHYIYGNWINNGTYVYGTSTIHFVGTGNILVSVSNFYHVVFAGTGTIAATGSITFYGDVTIDTYFDADAFEHYVHGNWIVNGVFVYGTSTIHFVGTGNIFIGVNNFYNVVFGGSGTVTATGSLTIYGYLTINNYFDAGSFSHFIYGNWTNNGTFVYGTSTIHFVGTGNIYIGISNFYHIVFECTGTVVATGSLTIYGDVTINNYFDAGSYDHYIHGNWFNYGTFVYGTSTIHFVGTGNIFIGVNNFYNVVFAGTGTITATGSLTFYGYVLISNHFNAGAFHHYVYGNWTNNGTFVYGTSTIHFVGTGSILVGTSSFFHVIFECSGSVKAAGSLTFYGDVTINNHFDADAFEHFVHGYWYNYGVFVYGTSTIHFVGSGNIFIGVSNFYNVVFAGSGTITATGSLTIYGYVLISNHFNAGSFTHYVHGNWTNNGTFVYGTSTFVFQGTVQQVIAGVYQTYFYNYTVDNPLGVLLNVNVTVYNSLTLTLGIITTGSYLITVEPAALIYGGSSTAYIYGRLVCGYASTGYRFFPVGNALYYGPMYLDYVTLAGTSYVQVEFTEGVINGTIPAFITFLAQRYWVISQSGGANFSFTVTLDVPGFNPSGTVWMLRGDGLTVDAFATTTPNYTNSDLFYSMGDFTLGEEVCADPYNLTYSDITYTSATLDWQPGYMEQKWNLEYGPAGFIPGTGTLISDITSKPVQITGLTPQTYYEFYVQAICSDNLQSNWVGPAPFGTFPKHLDVKVWLMGPYNEASGNMNTILSGSGLLPLSQPYQGYPWFYNGTEQVNSIPSGTVDWVLVEWRDAPSPSSATSATTLGRKAGFLLSDGSIVDTSGANLLMIGDPILSGNLYVVIQHRNHLKVMSSGGMTLNGQIYSWDFSSAAAQAYGGILAQKQLAPGVFGMISGDGNANGEVNNNDKNDVWAVQAGLGGYRSGDFSLDGQVNTIDKVEKWAPNTGSSSQVPY